MEQMYNMLTKEEQMVVDSLKNSEQNLKEIYKIISKKEIDEDYVKLFCDYFHTTKKVFNYLAIYYLKEKANPKEVERIKQIVKNRRNNNPKYYKKVIQNIINEPDPIQQKELLEQHREVYCLHAIHYGEETGQQQDIKKLNSMYHEILSHPTPQKRKPAGPQYQEKHLNLLAEMNEQIRGKLEQNNYYINDELQVIRDCLNLLSNRCNPNVLQKYRDYIIGYYKTIFHLVIEEYNRNPEIFNAVSYYSITNINPIRLFSMMKTPMNERQLSTILCKISSHRERTTGREPMILCEQSFSGEYVYQGVSLNKEQMIEIFRSIHPDIPKNEYICYEFFKDYIRKNFINGKDQKKLIK